MQRAKTVQLFLLFANLQSISGFDDYVDAAVSQTEHMLRRNADPDDIRLCYYAAALANLQYRRAIAARGAVSPTYAGDVTRHRYDAVPCELAERLLDEYRKVCAPLLSDGSGFVFQNITEGGQIDGT